jgi:hypothetical protein
MRTAESVAEVIQKRRWHTLLAGNLEASGLVGHLDSGEGIILKIITEIWILTLWI